MDKSRIISGTEIHGKTKHRQHGKDTKSFLKDRGKQIFSRSRDERKKETPTTNPSLRDVNRELRRQGA